MNLSKQVSHYLIDKKKHRKRRKKGRREVFFVRYEFDTFVLLFG